MRLASLADPERARRVLAVTLREGDLGRVAVPATVADLVRLKAAARGAEAGEVGAEGLAAGGLVFGWVGHDALDADGLQGVDGGCGAGLGEAAGEERAGDGVAAVRAGCDLGGSGAAGVEGVGCAVGVGGGGSRCA